MKANVQGRVSLKLNTKGLLHVGQCHCAKSSIVIASIQRRKANAFPARQQYRSAASPAKLEKRPRCQKIDPRRSNKSKLNVASIDVDVPSYFGEV
jgi:hypothetical protein